MFEDYFNDERIIAQICKERIKLAKARKDKQSPQRFSGSIPHVEPSHEYYQLLPPRKKWAAFRSKRRYAGSNPDQAALIKAVKVLRVKSPEQPWVVSLNAYIAQIRERVLSTQPFSLSSPTIKGLRKKPGKPEFRALCRFNTIDNLILCLFARYLCDAFDALFSPSSFAFRATSNGNRPDHHQAFNSIYEIRKKYAGRDLYVAECDIGERGWP